MDLGEEDQTKEPFSAHRIKCKYYLHDLSVLMCVDRDHPVKMVFVRAFHCEVTPPATPTLYFLEGSHYVVPTPKQWGLIFPFLVEQVPT